MATREENIITRVEIDADKAQQDIIKLNAIASDSTKSLEQRLQAKNKQIEIQNKLSKQTVSDQREEVKLLEGLGASEKELERAKKRLNQESAKATRLAANNEKAQNRLNKSYIESKDPIKQLDKATGGLIGKMQMFLSNPIGVVITALVGIFSLFKKAINSTEDGAASFNAVMAAIGQVFTNLITFLSAKLEPIFTWLAEFLAKNINPAFAVMNSFVDAAKSGFMALWDMINLGLTPIKALIAGLRAAGAALKGDFSGAKQIMSDFKDEVAETAKSLVTNLVDAVEKTVEAVKGIEKTFNDAVGAGDNLISRAAQIELAQNRLNKTKREQELLDAKLNVISKEALRNFEDQTLSIEERSKALQDFVDIERKRAKNQTALLNEEIRLMKERQSLGGNTKEDEEALNQLLIQRVNLQAGLADQERKFFKFRERIGKEEFAAAEAKRKLEEQERLDKEKRLIDEADRNLEAQLERDEIDIERRKALGERTLELELELLNKRMEQELSNTELLESERAAIIEKYALATQKVKDAESKGKQKAEEAYKKTAIEATAEAFGISKEVSLAQMLMAAPKAIGNSFAKASETYPFPLSLAMGAAGAVGTVAPILKSVATIKSTKVPGLKASSGGGGSVSMPTTAAIGDVSANNAARMGTDPSLTQSATQTAAASVSGSASSNITFSEDSYNDFQNQVQFKEDKTTF